MALVFVGASTDAHSFRSQVGTGSESDCLFGQLNRMLWISDSKAGVKTEKSGGVAGGEDECADVVAARVAGERKMGFGYFACEKRSKPVCK